MLYAIHCLDHEGSPDLRLQHYDAHKAYLEAASIKTIISGPLLSSDRRTMIGSPFIVAAQSLADVEAFNAADPFARHKVWRRIEIHPFAMRVDHRDSGTGAADPNH